MAKRGKQNEQSYSGLITAKERNVYDRELQPWSKRQSERGRTYGYNGPKRHAEHDKALQTWPKGSAKKGAEQRASTGRKKPVANVGARLEAAMWLKVTERGHGALKLAYSLCFLSRHPIRPQESLFVEADAEPGDAKAQGALLEALAVEDPEEAVRRYESGRFAM